MQLKVRTSEVKMNQLELQVMSLDIWDDRGHRAVFI